MEYKSLFTSSWWSKETVQKTQNTDKVDEMKANMQKFHKILSNGLGRTQQAFQSVSMLL